MSVEIERKFLVIRKDWRASADRGRQLRQGYIAHDSHGSVRVRIAEDRAWLTVKSARSGLVRHEFEYEIPINDAEEMLAGFCSGILIQKTRYRVTFAGKIWEIDVFHGPAEGLIVAEVELQTVDERLELPPWIGEEVTHDPRYRNSAIALMPSVEMAEPNPQRDPADGIPPLARLELQA
ncbi:CYTH domain-containing protein (plasmid) [Sphingobium fuliginis]|jgi:adenylate cyclase|uniref:CYTH domain-containing protein n=1 Tax=Sphingobium fuliginis (strain ATCC 27551) TaxID=336203 RepID=A0A7M2GPA4_SPHSA|nr:MULTISPECIES: CYTH domain-containing protein [Sphingobium]QOT74511.1 CYTH domain-containing protein [Sphingobium fuliginis]